MTTININLLPEEMRPRAGGGAMGSMAMPEQGVIVPIAIGAVIAVALAAVPSLATSMYFDPKNAELDSLAAEVDSEINKYNTDLKTLKALGDNRDALRQQLLTLQSVAGGRTPLADQLNELRSLTPANLWFDSFKNDNTTGKLTLSGAALDYSSVAYFHRNLQNSEYFMDPVLSKTEAGDSGKEGVPTVKFTMTVSLKTPSAASPQQ